MPITKLPLKHLQRDEMSHLQLDSTQLEKIKLHLDLVLLALEALAGVDRDAMLQAASYLNLELQLPSLEAGQQIDSATARSLVSIICYLAKQHQELIRRAVTLLEQQIANDREPHEISLLGDYLNTFNQYQQRWSDTVSTPATNNVAQKLLVELLFYSGPTGHRRLWSVLLNR